jgi:hypothetical protein
MKEFFFGKSISVVEFWLMCLMIGAVNRGYNLAAITSFVLYIIVGVLNLTTITIVDDEVESSDENHRVA